MQQFGYEDLKVWDRAVAFAVMVIDAAESIDSGRQHYRLLEQIESAAASIAMNIAEGKGRFSPKEFRHFCYIARGSLYETTTLLEIFHRKAWIPTNIYNELKSEAIEIAAMIKGLINSIEKRKTSSSKLKAEGERHQ